MHARYYANAQGRFTGPDAVAGSIGNPQSFNGYAYVGNNAVNFSDPTGHFWEQDEPARKRSKWNDEDLRPKWELCGSCGGQNPNTPQDPSKPSLTPAIAPSGVPDIPEGTVGTPTVTEFQPIPPHRGFWQRIKTFFGFGSATAAGTGVSMWGKPETLQDHFYRHGADYGARTQEEYADQAQELFLRAAEGEAGLKMKISSDGVIRVLDTQTGDFGAYNMNGTTRTMFRISRAFEMYFGRQPGRSPWFPRSAEPEVEPEVEPEIVPEIPIPPIP